MGVCLGFFSMSSLLLTPSVSTLCVKNGTHQFFFILFNRVEFVSYCLDRGKRILDLKAELVSLAADKKSLSEKADAAFKKYEEVSCNTSIGQNLANKNNLAPLFLGKRLTGKKQ
jgi:hypothetical protein